MNIKQLLNPFAKGFTEADHAAASRNRNSYEGCEELLKRLEKFFHKKIPDGLLKKGVHVCSARGKWDLLALLEQTLGKGDFVVKHSLRSQSNKPDAKGSLIIELLLENKQQSYIHVTEDKGYDLSVISSDANAAEEMLASLREEFLPIAKAAKKKKAFFNLINITKNRVESKRIKLRKNYQLSSSSLDLHYGETFADWEQGFVEKLGQGTQGLTIFRGDPGTGKTFFIRHLISRLRETHRFYLINLSDFDLLTSPSMVEFWSDELDGISYEIPFGNDMTKDAKKRRKKIKRVIIIEDAERLLSTRTKGEAGNVSELLNMCDGLLGDFLQLHLICTANCPMEDFDPAVVRAGRLVAMKEFLPLDEDQAQILAGKIGIELKAGNKYTLADIYNQAPSGAEDIAEAAKIGFRES